MTYVNITVPRNRLETRLTAPWDVTILLHISVIT
jgi:hypothetical protein